jgi:hypothetical protein
MKALLLLGSLLASLDLALLVRLWEPGLGQDGSGDPIPSLTSAHDLLAQATGRPIWEDEAGPEGPSREMTS